jgi:AbrB family looped-hinge helix DNA binding protein
MFSMTRPAVQRKIVRPLAKGQITIPAAFRKALGIGRDTLLEVSLTGDHLEIAPVSQGADILRRYTEEEVARFMEEARLEPEVAERVRLLLRRGML